MKKKKLVRSIKPLEKVVLPLCGTFKGVGVMISSIGGEDDILF